MVQKNSQCIICKTIGENNATINNYLQCGRYCSKQIQ